MSDVPETIVFGWGAPPMRQQLPALTEEQAEHFDLDNKALYRLSIRGVITTAERDRAVKRLIKNVALVLGEAPR